MIYCINYKSWEFFGKTMAAHFRLRYRLLIEGQYWQVGRFQGMEYDQYDTPAATYLVYEDAEGQVRGSVRAVPTDRPYMLRDVWPDMFEKMPAPDSLSVWEASRFCVDPSLSRAEKDRVRNELVCAFLEFGLQNDISGMVGVMPAKLWQGVFLRASWPVEFISGEKHLDSGDVIIAGYMPIRPDILKSVREATGITAPVLTAQPVTPAPEQPHLKMPLVMVGDTGRKSSRRVAA